MLYHLKWFAGDERLEQYVIGNPAFGWEIAKKMRRVEGVDAREFRVEVRDEYA